MKDHRIQTIIKAEVYRLTALAATSLEFLTIP